MAAKPGVPLEGIDDFLLGLFGTVIPPCQRLDHAVRYFSTWSGSDKLLMLAQYGVKVLAPLIQARAEIQFRAGKRAKPLSPSSEGLSKFATHLGIARRVSGFWGILAIIKGLSALERSRPASRTKLNLERLQGLSMLIFYPLEYISFFSSPLAPVLKGVSPNDSLKASIWSVRAWGTYVVLQVALLIGEWRELVKTGRALSRGESDADPMAVRKRKQAIAYQMVANVSRLPVILHWSMIGGLYKNEFWTNFLSFVSALAAIRGGWEATRVPPPKR